MDVETRATDVQFPRKYLILIFLLFPFTFWVSHLAYAFIETQPIHFSGDKQVWDRKANRVELIGHASVTQPSETIKADFILLDLKSKTLNAKGNCIYIADSFIIWSEGIYFNLSTRVGSVEKGYISNDQFSFRGDHIEQVGRGHFLMHNGEYSTCKDCAPSWSFQAEDIDVQIEDYAYLSNVKTKVKDIPALWFPYLVVPLKTKRQTGLLFPSLVFSGANGAQYVLPFFWAINPSLDMTFGLGTYTLRGLRSEFETRYVINSRSDGKLNLYYLTDRNFDVSSSRWAIDFTERHIFPFGIDQKLRLSEVSDNLYPYFFQNDIPGLANEAFLPSKLIFSKSSADMSSYLVFQTYRNLLNSNPSGSVSQKIEFDPSTVQAFPAVVLTTNDQFLLGNQWIGGISFGLHHFTRFGGNFDYDSSAVPFGEAAPNHLRSFLPGVDPIRKAVRLSVTPSVYTTIIAFDTISIIPSLQYQAYYYDFLNLVQPLTRGYILFQTDLSAQLQRIYDHPNDVNYPKTKHLIRPLLTYSYIPYIESDQNHPFLAQISHAQKNNINGYMFDNLDIVPVSYNQSNANYFIPIGHSLSYGVTTQWIRRRGALDLASPVYQNSVELSAGQAINFLEISNPIDPENPHIFTRFFSTAIFNYDHFTSQTTYYYYPDVPAYPSRHALSTSGTYILERSLHQRVLSFDRSFSLVYTYNQLSAAASTLTSSINYSVSDYLLPTASVSYSFQTQQLGSVGFGMKVQSPSRCWSFGTAMSYVSGLPGVNFNFDFKFNFTGSSLNNIGDFASQSINQLGSGRINGL